jgi:hypothetical protein
VGKFSNNERQLINAVLAPFCAALFAVLELGDMEEGKKALDEAASKEEFADCMFGFSIGMISSLAEATDHTPTEIVRAYAMTTACFGEGLLDEELSDFPPAVRDLLKRFIDDDDAK